MNVSERIKTQRLASGLTQDQIASRVGVTRVAVSHWERGEADPNGRYLNDLAKALGVSVEWLLTGDETGTNHLVAFTGTPASGKSSDLVNLTRQRLEQMNAEQRAAFLSDSGYDNLLVLSSEAHRSLSGVAEENAGLSNVEPAVIPQGGRVPILSYVQAGNWREMCEQATGFDGNVEYVTASVDIGPRGFGLWLRGNSMTPQFNEGDLVIVDPDEQPRPGDFVVAKNGSEEATFKKYRPRGIDEHGQEVFELVPLNDDFPPMYSDRQHIEIIGVMVEHRIFRKR
ncbi:MAG: helix-turn-helix domain-containing protein [Aeromonas veronii]